MAEPMTAAQLQRVLVGEKVKIKPHAGWTTHERDDETGKPFGPVHGVMIHHTGGQNAGSVIWNGRSDLPGPLAHLYITKEGVAELMSAGRANHAGLGDADVFNAVKAESYSSRPPAPNQQNKDGNDCFYGFECENAGTGKDPWPDVQYIAMVRSAAAICRFYGWTAKSCIGHLEWTNQKVDPKGFAMVSFRTDLAACLRAKPGTWPTPKAEAPLTVEQRLDRIEKKLDL